MAGDPEPLHPGRKPRALSKWTGNPESIFCLEAPRQHCLGREPRAFLFRSTDRPAPEGLPGALDLSDLVSVDRRKSRFRVSRGEPSGSWIASVPPVSTVLQTGHPRRVSVSAQCKLIETFS
jgi:hypothetical protein